MKNFVDNLRNQVLDPRTDEERISNITSLLTAGYCFGCDNKKTIERHYATIIAYVEEFLQPLTDEQKGKLPNGVKDRPEAAKKEAEEYRDKLAAMYGVPRYAGRCDECPQAALLGSGNCANCARP